MKINYFRLYIRPQDIYGGTQLEIDVRADAKDHTFKYVIDNSMLEQLTKDDTRSLFDHIFDRAKKEFFYLFDKK